MDTHTSTSTSTQHPKKKTPQSVLSLDSRADVHYYGNILLSAGASTAKFLRQPFLSTPRINQDQHFSGKKRHVRFLWNIKRVFAKKLDDWLRRLRSDYPKLGPIG